MATDQATTARVLQYGTQYQERFLQELLAFLRIPSVSTQADHKEDMVRAAEWLADAMSEAGLENVRLISTERHPLVYGDWLHAGEGAPTVLIYGHYDVQPAEPLDLWESPPFEPEIRDEHVYARGAADDKGQLYIHVKAVEAWLQSAGRLPVNVKFMMEGEEESGGQSLAAFIPRETEMLDADVALISDTAMLGRGRPAIVYGLRGICYMFLDVTGPTRDLHSGAYGGGINNPLNVLGHLIAKLKDERGHVLIPGFYDDVRPLSDEEREVLSRFPLDEAEWLAETGAPAVWGEPHYTLVERLGARPTLDVHGIIGGYTGEGAKTVLPSSVHAKISMRLVPDQDPRTIEKLFRSYVESVTPPSVRVKIQARGGSPAVLTDYDTPAIQAAMHALEEVFSEEPVLMRSGGSIPVVGLFQEHLGVETVLMGFSLPDARIHSPNERFYLQNFFDGIEAVVRFYATYARREEEDRRELSAP